MLAIYALEENLRNHICLIYNCVTKIGMYLKGKIYISLKYTILDLEESYGITV